MSLKDPSLLKDPFLDSKSRQENVVDSRVVGAFHTRDDLDTSKQAHHHSIGVSSATACSGNHNHRGSDSALLLEGVTLTGSRGGNAALPSIISALVELGATDSTTA
jgi:hypothetical protein